jgi:hypothetical protein
MVSPVRIRVPPLIKVLQIAEKTKEPWEHCWDPVSTARLRTRLL